MNRPSLAFFYVALLLTPGCRDNAPQSSPHEILAEALGDAVPPTATNPEGDMASALDCSVWARFRADGAFATWLLSSGFREVDCTAAARYFVYQESPSRFDPVWRPSVLPGTTCYFKASRAPGRRWWRFVLLDSHGVAYAVAFTLPLEPGS